MDRYIGPNSEWAPIWASISFYCALEFHVFYACLPLAGMELFEEALLKWEEALTIRQRDPTSSLATWDNIKEPEFLPEELPEVWPCD